MRLKNLAASLVVGLGLSLFPTTLEQVAQSSASEQLPVAQAPASAPASAPTSAHNQVKNLSFYPRDLVMLTKIGHYTQIKFRITDTDFFQVPDNKPISVSTQWFKGAHYGDLAEIKISFFHSDKNLDSTLENITKLNQTPQISSKEFIHGKYVVYGFNSCPHCPEESPEYLAMGWYQNTLFAVHTTEAKPDQFILSYMDSLLKARETRQPTESLPYNPPRITQPRLTFPK